MFLSKNKFAYFSSADNITKYKGHTYLSSIATVKICHRITTHVQYVRKKNVFLNKMTNMNIYIPVTVQLHAIYSNVLAIYLTFEKTSQFYMDRHYGFLTISIYWNRKSWTNVFLVWIRQIFDTCLFCFKHL